MTALLSGLAPLGPRRRPVDESADGLLENLRRAVLDEPLVRGDDGAEPPAESVGGVTESAEEAVSYTHLTLPTTPYV